mgnify:CR=1 FL=1
MKLLDVINPATEETMETIPALDVDAVDAAVESQEGRGR